ncbi:12886_t:CDS:2 [Funneliformis geosporum]|uniref:2843_t:CDS:1 n=1 Tax=Funneliformis geosporum TaxID=1117311 RepID=A0A9W4WNW7_9GLOM|nr:2843_t:CDS:2 [Funneliformis geosporum]CAI2170969.1 12886_t:CDS:2 [Funneliformis geosporum]
MDLSSKLRENKQRLDSGEINKDEYDKRRKSILKKWKEDTTPNKSESSSHSSESDLYRVLELTPNATEGEIKSKYKKLSLKYHPDKNGGFKTEEWHRLSMAYQILSDDNRRALYDQYRTVDDGKESFNYHVGGDSWKPYIGDLEIGFRFFSYIGDKSLPELEYITSAEQKERRISNIVNYLQEKLSRMPKKGDPEFESVEQSLRQEILKLVEEPNGKNLLSLLGRIYVSSAEAHLNRGCMEVVNYNYSLNFIWFMKLICSSLTLLATRDKVTGLAWKISKSEIESIARETSEKVNNNNDQLADSLKIFGNLWIEISNSKNTRFNLQDIRSLFRI